MLLSFSTDKAEGSVSSRRLVVLGARELALPSLERPCEEWLRSRLQTT